jgi:hypothetical protein
MWKLIFIFLFFGLGFGKDKNQKITIVNVVDTGKAEVVIDYRLLCSCVESMPDPDSLEGILSSDNEFVKGINGDPINNAWVRKYSAMLELPYMIQERELMTIAIKSLDAKDPMLKELKKLKFSSRLFLSDSRNGDSFAGRSNRQYYFSTPELAMEDVRNKAKVWIQNRKNILCK